jgi:CDP-glucose 4,6-dehydratase
MVISDKKFWKGRNVLVTGINGFIGGNLAGALVSNQANVFGIIRNHKPSTFLEYEKLSERVTLIQGSLCDKDLLEQIISEEQIEFIFHLAAQVEVGIAVTNPFITFETNVRGTYTLLEAARRFPDNINPSLLHLRIKLMALTR